MGGNTVTTYSVCSYNMKFDTCGGHNVYQIDGMSDPIIYGDSFSTEEEARAMFNELAAGNQPRERFTTEKQCGGNPDGYALTLEANTFDCEGGELGEFITGETLESIEYTADDYAGDNQ